jgi:hypothetical protein
MASSVLTVRQFGLEVSDTAPPAAEPNTPTPIVAAQKAKDFWDWALPFLAVAVVVVAWRLAYENIADSTYSRTAKPTVPIEGLTIFAVFFVAASGLERLLEPFSVLWDKSKVEAQSALKEAAAAVAEYKGKVKTWNDAADAAAKAAAKQAADDAATDVDTKLQTAAVKQAAAAATDGRKALVAWGLATVLGVLASASLKLYLLKQVGIASPPRELEILATGLILGSGTKPLHDLVTLVEKKKEAATTASASAAA